MTNEPATPSLYAKLAAVMSEIGYVEKKGYNDWHKYKYVTEADLVDAVREKLAARNIILIPSVVQIDERAVTSDKGKQSTVTTVRVAFTFCDGDSGETHRAEWAGAGDDPADKGLYKAYTGAVKYFLMKSFLIPTGDDPEADSRTDERSSGGQTNTVQPEGIGETGALVLLGGAESAGVLDDKLQLAVSHVARRDLSWTDRAGALASLGSLNNDQATAVDRWITRKEKELEIPS